MVDNKKLLKNTMFLYIRMIFLMALSLWTSRLFLQVLGVENFGIYNIVGSVMVMFGFLNSALVGSTRRFINVSAGKNDLTFLKKTFSTSLYIHVLLSILMLIIGESFGLWFLNNELNIPEAKMNSANWVFQLSVIGTCIGIIGSPFEAAIVAEEKMSIYAYISILEAIIKVCILLFLMHNHDLDALICYASLLFLTGVVINIIKWLYCNFNFKYCLFNIRRDKALFKEMFSFSGWSVYGQLGVIASSTGLNILINIFWGVTLNAAIGIANQINNAINSFVTNLQTAFNPQLVKTHAQNDFENHKKLLSRATKASYMLLLMISLPVVFNMQYLLDIWLTSIPEYTGIFAILIILHSLIEALASPLWMSMQAIGNIRNYQLIISCSHFITLGGSYICLKSGFSPASVFFVKLGVQLLIYVFRINYILPKIDFPVKQYIKINIIPVAVSTIISIMLIMSTETILSNPPVKLLIQTFVSIIGFLIAYRFLLTTPAERKSINNLIIAKIGKIKTV